MKVKRKQKVEKMMMIKAKKKVIMALRMLQW
jgi:hypothetical protein